MTKNQNNKISFVQSYIKKVNFRIPKFSTANESLLISLLISYFFCCFVFRFFSLLWQGCSVAKTTFHKRCDRVLVRSCPFSKHVFRQSDYTWYMEVQLAAIVVQTKYSQSEGKIDFFHLELADETKESRRMGLLLNFRDGMDRNSGESCDKTFREVIFSRSNNSLEILKMIWQTEVGEEAFSESPFGTWEGQKQFSLS